MSDKYDPQAYAEAQDISEHLLALEEEKIKAQRQNRASASGLAPHISTSQVLSKMNDNFFHELSLYYENEALEELLEAGEIPDLQNENPLTAEYDDPTLDRINSLRDDKKRQALERMAIIIDSQLRKLK